MPGCYEALLSILNANWSSWPLVVIVCICLVNRFYHNEISALLGRISIVKWGEKQIELNSNIQQVQTVNDNVDKDHHELIKYYDYEVIYNCAYGTQLQMLIDMKNMGDKPMLYQNAINYFFYHRSLLPMRDQFVSNENSYFEWMQGKVLLLDRVMIHLC